MDKDHSKAATQRQFMCIWPYASRIVIMHCHQSSLASVTNTTTTTTTLDLFLFRSIIQQQQQQQQQSHL